MKILIVLPVLNEEENLPEIVSEILGLKKNFDILIINDRSVDKTGSVANSLKEKHSEVFVMHRKGKRGLGRSYLDGFKWALKKDYDFVFQMDADGSHEPRFLPMFLDKMKDNDVVIGSRYFNKRISVVNWDLKRLFLSLMANLYAKIVTGVPVSDATAGFKCFKRNVLEKIDLNKVLSEGYSFQIEMNWRAHKAGFKIGEIPIIFYERRHGESKLSTNIIKEGLLILWKIKFRR